MHSHFLERTVAVLYNIFFIYLFSLSSSLSPTSLSFPHSLSHFVTLSLSLSLSLSLISSLPHNKIIHLRSAWWRGEWRDGVRLAWRRSMWRPVWRLACCVFSGGCFGRCLGFLWQFFVFLVVVVSCCDRSCGCNVWWVLMVLSDGFG